MLLDDNFDTTLVKYFAPELLLEDYGGKLTQVTEVERVMDYPSVKEYLLEEFANVWWINMVNRI